MALIISLLATFTSIANAGASCSLNTKLSDTCGSITISGVNNGPIDGTYNRIDDSLFQKTDGSNNYLSYWFGSGGVYLGNAIGDVRCELETGNYGLSFDASEVDGIVVGEAEAFTAGFPSRTVQIACNSASNVQAPVTPAPTQPTIVSEGSLCFSTSSTATLTSGSGITIDIANLAGEYTAISGGINGKAAFELVSSCGTSSTLMYAPSYGKYMFVRNRNRVSSTYYLSCSNVDEIASGNVASGLCEGNLQAYFSLNTASGSCSCGRS